MDLIKIKCLERDELELFKIDYMLEILMEYNFPKRKHEQLWKNIDSFNDAIKKRNKEIGELCNESKHKNKQDQH